MKVNVYVTLKPGVLDPQGRAIHHALEGLGFDGVAVFGFDIMRQRAGEEQAGLIKLAFGCGPSDDFWHLGLEHIKVQAPFGWLSLKI